MKNLLFLFSTVIVFSSCSSLRKCHKNPDLIEITETNYELLNGTYTDDSFQNKDSIKGNLHWDFFDRGYNNVNLTEHIKLTMINEKTIRVNYYDGDSIVRTKEFNGKIKDGYFNLKRKYFIMPALYVNAFRNRKFRIGILSNNNLITDYHQILFGTVFFLYPVGENVKEYDVEFERINK